MGQMHGRFRIHCDSRFATFRALTAPLKALALAHLHLILFTAFLSGTTLVLALMATRVVEQSIGTFVGIAMAPAISLSISVLLWAMAAPIVLVAVIIPFRALWYKDENSIIAFLEETFPALGRAYLSTIISALGLFLSGILLSALFLAVGYALRGPISDTQAQLAGFVAAGLLGLFMLQNLLALLVMPFLVIGSGLSIRDALSSAPRLLQGHRIGLIFVTLLGAGATVLIVASGDAGTFAHKDLFGLAAASWYTLSVICVLCFAASENLNSSQFRALRSLASPIKVEKKTTRRAPPQKPEAPEPKTASQQPFAPLLRAPGERTLNVPSRSRRDRRTSALTAREREILFGGA